MLKLKNSCIFNPGFNKGLQKLSESNLDNVKELIAIAKVVKAVQAEAQTIFQIRNNLLKEYNVTIKDDVISIGDESRAEEFNIKINDLFVAVFEIPLEEKIPVSDKMSETLTSQDLLALEEILEY